MERIFLDVGGYKGDSVYASLDPIFSFDKVYCFEPVAQLGVKLKSINNDRLTVVQAGLFDCSCERPIYHAGTLAGSVYADSPRYLEDGYEEVCKFIEASEFFREKINQGDVVFMKLNCEGAECSILENLLSSGEAGKLTEALVDFDALKIPSQAARVKQLIQTMHDQNLPYHTPEEVQYGMINNYGGIRNWLLVTGAAQGGAITRLKSAYYQLKIMLTKNYNGYYKMRILRRMTWLKPIVDQLRGRVI